MAITSPIAHRLAITALLATACASHRADTSVDPADQCWFVVYNRTAYALDVRVLRDATGVGARTLGTINPGERLTDWEPCSRTSVLVRGVAVPPQVGGRTEFGYVQGGAELEPGQEVEVWLHFP